MADPRFKYEDITPPVIPIDILDGLARSVFTVKTINPLGWVLAGAKLALAAVYLIARRASIVQSRLIQKQRYEVEQAAGNQSAIDGDDLSSEKRPDV